MPVKDGYWLLSECQNNTIIVKYKQKKIDDKDVSHGCWFNVYTCENCTLMSYALWPHCKDAYHVLVPWFTYLITVLTL